MKTEIRYFTSGITWSADYVCEANANENEMRFAGNVRVTNRSGEDYPEAQVRLVVGVVRLVERIIDLAQQNQPNAPRPTVATMRPESKTKTMLALGGAVAEAEENAKAVVKEALGEYFLYTVEGRDTIQNGWSKRLPSFNTPEVPITSYYKYEKERYGNAVMRFYKFKNDEDSKLGTEPLPDGSVMAFRTVTDDSLYNFVGLSLIHI